MLFSEFLPSHHPYRQLIPFFQKNRPTALALVSLLRIFEQLPCLSLEAAQAKLTWWEHELYQVWNAENYKANHPISIELHKIKHTVSYTKTQQIQNFIDQNFPILIQQTRQHIERIRYEHEHELQRFWLGFYGFFLGLLDLLQGHVNSFDHTRAATFGLLHLLTGISQTLSYQRFDIPLLYLSEIHCSASVLLQRQNTHPLWQKIARKIAQKIIENLLYEPQSHQKKMVKNWLLALKDTDFKCLNQQIYPKVCISFFIKPIF